MEISPMKLAPSATTHRHEYLRVRDKIEVSSLSRRRHELPLYEYRCLKKCPHCGGKMESVLTAPAIQFKGSGWYVTDYGRKNSGGDSSKSESSEQSEKSEKSEKSE